MHVFLRSIQTLLLILIFGIGTWVNAARADVGVSMASPGDPEVSSAGSTSDCQHEEQPTGEANDGDGESAEDGKQVALPDFRVEMPRRTALSSGCLNEELPLRGRETRGELFRPPRA